MSVRFFSIFVDEANGDLEIPSAFVNIHWGGVSNPTKLILPNNVEWEVKWRKENNNTLLNISSKGFLEFYSVGKGYMLLFCYNEQIPEIFRVSIFNHLGMEITYPPKRKHCGKQCRREEAYEEYIQYISPTMRGYIEKIVDVPKDGNCGFHVIADFIGGKTCAIVREELLEELKSDLERYRQIFGGVEQVDHIAGVLSSTNEWMEFPSMGILIATRYRVALVTLAPTGSTTYFPIRGTVPDPPVFITMAHIAKYHHYVKVFLKPGFPIPPVYPGWADICDPESMPWSDFYDSLLQQYQSGLQKRRLPESLLPKRKGMARMVVPEQHQKPERKRRAKASVAEDVHNKSSINGGEGRCSVEGMDAKNDHENDQEQHRDSHSENHGAGWSPNDYSVSHSIKHGRERSPDVMDAKNGPKKDPKHNIEKPQGKKTQRKRRGKALEAEDEGSSAPGWFIQFEERIIKALEALTESMAEVKELLAEH